MAGTTLTYNGNNLQTANFIIEEIDHHSFPTISATQYPIDHDNQSAIPFITYPNKTITVTGMIIGSSIADCDAKIDTFKSYLLGNDQPLVIGYNGTTRQYTATADKVEIKRPGGLAFANFTLEFLCDYPFGQDPSSTTALTATGRTAATYTDTETFNGTAPYQLPIITITYSSTLSGGTNTQVYFSNSSTGQAIVVQRNWTTGDVLVIDATQKTVTVNGLPVAFKGAFPLFPPGSQSMEYSDGFTARTFAITVTYTASYL